MAPAECAAVASLPRHFACNLHLSGLHKDEAGIASMCPLSTVMHAQRSIRHSNDLLGKVGCPIAKRVLQPMAYSLLMNGLGKNALAWSC